MSVDRELWEKTFTKNSFPAWICPTCFKGVIRPVKNSFLSDETSDSLEAHDHPAWGPEWISLKCVVLLKCSNPDCRETITMIGKGSVEEMLGYDFDGNTKHETIESFEPIYFDPPLFPFQLPSKCPNDIKEMVIDSFRLFLSDPDSAGNKIRVAVERILTNHKIQKSRRNKKNQRVMRSLHERIELYEKKNSEIAQMLMAIKWLGNAGSHDGKRLTMKKILDAYEIIEHVLEELYSPRKHRVKRLVRTINRSKKI
ncbi:MAG: DUF4145 domain-containing protein [Planctomycetota bacterium]|jgi:hypothetical protein